MMHYPMQYPLNPAMVGSLYPPLGPMYVNPDYPGPHNAQYMQGGAPIHPGVPQQNIQQHFQSLGINTNPDEAIKANLGQNLIQRDLNESNLVAKPGQS